MIYDYLYDNRNARPKSVADRLLRDRSVPPLGGGGRFGRLGFS